MMMSLHVSLLPTAAAPYHAHAPATHAQAWLPCANRAWCVACRGCAPRALQMESWHRLDTLSIDASVTVVCHTLQQRHVTRCGGGCRSPLHGAFPKGEHHSAATVCFPRHAPSVAAARQLFFHSTVTTLGVVAVSPLYSFLPTTCTPAQLALQCATVLPPALCPSHSAAFLAAGPVPPATLTTLGVHGSVHHGRSRRRRQRQWRRWRWRWCPRCSDSDGAGACSGCGGHFLAVATWRGGVRIAATALHAKGVHHQVSGARLGASGCYGSGFFPLQGQCGSCTWLAVRRQRQRQPDLGAPYLSHPPAQPPWVFALEAGTAPRPR